MQRGFPKRRRVERKRRVDWVVVMGEDWDLGGSAGSRLACPGGDDVDGRPSGPLAPPRPVQLLCA